MCTVSTALAMRDVTVVGGLAVEPLLSSLQASGVAAPSRTQSSKRCGAWLTSRHHGSRAMAQLSAQSPVMPVDSNAPKSAPRNGFAR